ncbi:MAG TPA: aldo/keto reductase [Pilimelia sp.]|nr:aldo/keto reductase [Pilimelia sp.]
MTQTVTLPGKIELPLVGFGTWQLRGKSAYESVRYALEIGYRHLDTATIYGNEAEVGRALRDSGVDRADVFVTTKLPPERAGQERRTLDTSLRSLGVDQVDLWLIHWPPRGGAASRRLWQQVRAARDAGLALTIGVSNYSLAQLDDLIGDSGEAPAVNQVPWSPVEHDPTVLAGNRARGVLLEGYSPLKRSNLTDPVLVEIAQRYGVTPAQVVLRWHLEHNIPVIPKSGRRERIAANLDLFGFSLSTTDVARIDALGA